MDFFYVPIVVPWFCSLSRVRMGDHFAGWKDVISTFRREHRALLSQPKSESIIHLGTRSAVPTDPLEGRILAVALFGEAPQRSKRSGGRWEAREWVGLGGVCPTENFRYHI